jgi:MOSC domain-containing protein YiiM
MFQGQLFAIFIAPRAAEGMQAVAEVEALAGRGLLGDRYAAFAGTFSRGQAPQPCAPKPDEEVTLIESEALAAVQGDYGLELAPAETRRNLLTRNVPLNHLVAREFLIGEVRLRGLRLCEPCQHLEKLTGKDLRKALTHRGGLRAQIVVGGILRVGDAIRPSTD